MEPSHTRERPLNMFTSLVSLQHLLLLVKLVMSVLIPDEPDWIRRKREHIEFTSMDALRQQVSPVLHTLHPPHVTSSTRYIIHMHMGPLGVLLTWWNHTNKLET